MNFWRIGEKINLRLQTILDQHTAPWGVKVTNVEVKQVDMPETMLRAMAKQAEAERERRSKIIHAEGEFSAAQRLVDAAALLATEPVSVQLRYLQTLTEIGVEKNTTVIFPIPMDLFFWNAQHCWRRLQGRKMRRPSLRAIRSWLFRAATRCSTGGRCRGRYQLKNWVHGETFQNRKKNQRRLIAMAKDPEIIVSTGKMVGAFRGSGCGWRCDFRLRLFHGPGSNAKRS